MNEPKTPNLGLNKIDRSSPSTTYFDLDKYLDQNWEKVDEGVGQVEERAAETAERVSSIQERLDTEKRKSVTLEQGLQIINAERTSAFKLEGLKGRTLVNLLGRDGGFEGYSNWGIGAASATLDTTVYTQGSMSSLKVTLASTNSNISKTVSTSVGKTYILIADVKNVSTSSAFVSISTVVNGNVITGTTFGTSFARFTATASTHAIAVVGGGESGQVFNADNVRLYEVSSAEYVALNSMTPEQVAAKYPYVDSVHPIRNPYAIRYGENLIPPFYEATYRTKSSKIIDPYTYQQTAVSTDSWTRFTITVLPQTDYHLSFSSLNGKAMLAVFSVDEKVLLLNYGQGGRTFNSGVHTQISVYINGTGDRVDTIINPMLTLGKTAKPFKPREDVMLALQTDLYADSVTGTNADEVFERDGQYFKLAKWRKVVLDGSFTHLPFGSGTGFKVINALLPESPAVDGSGLLTKYQGEIIKETDYATVSSQADNLNIGSSGANGVFDNFQISIANIDSGWGDSYTPTAEEIKAYFMGWKMYDVNTNPDGSGVYNRTDGVGKWFVPVNRSSGGVNVLPTAKVPTVASYQLLYQLATPTVEPITFEGQLTFIEGVNQVEIGTGLVVREKAAILSVPGSAAAIGDIGNPTAYKVEKFIRAYKNSKHDPSWYASTLNPYGAEKARIDWVNFDPAAAYSVTYLMLDKHPVAPFIGSVADNEKALLMDLVQDVQQVNARLSVVESKEDEKDAPAWITPTLLSGITFNNYPINRQGYYKNSLNVVQLSLAIIGPNNGGIAQNTLICILPVGYRPSSNVFITGTNTNAQGLNAQALSIVINSEGQVVLTSLPTTPSQLSVTVSGVFLAEQ